MSDSRLYFRTKPDYSKNWTEVTSDYSIVDANYGKGNVKILHVERHGKVHDIMEVEVSTKLVLDSKVDYTMGDNRDIIATDTQKNLVFVLAKKYGIKTPEEFALQMCDFFLEKYPQVVKAVVTVQKYPWQRIPLQGQEHNHAFIMVPVAERHSTVTRCRRGEPVIESGLSGLRVLKTTQSAFVDFVQDEFRTLPDAPDRICSTMVTSSWVYSTWKGINFDKAWDTVQEAILEKFAGCPENGIYSPSVQNTLYEAEKASMDRVPQIESIEMTLPNKHYVDVDLSKFPADYVGASPNKTVFLPLDKPQGVIYGKLARKQKSKL